MKVSLANVSVRGRPTFAVDDLVWVSWPAEAGVLVGE
jgi:hypothetical protein